MPGLTDPLVLAIGVGVLLALGAALVIAGTLRRTTRLADAFGALDPAASTVVTWIDQRADADPDTGWDSRLGRFGYTRLRVPVSAATRRRLELRGRTISDFVAEKLIWAIAGLLVPQVYLAVWLLLTGSVTTTPLVASLALMVLGFCWPDIALRRGQKETHEDVRQQLLSFFDLVTLERLANQSAISSLHAAAEMSDNLVFRRVRSALERARLEQRPPWPDLERLATELELPEIGDLADVLQLDEQGAALARALRARVKELRDAQLTREKVTAQAISESMTIWMVIPTFMIGVLLIAPPILRLAGLA